MTSKGDTLDYNLVYPNIKSTFPRSMRWEYIRDISNRTKAEVGPGRYNLPPGLNVSDCTTLNERRTNLHFVSSNSPILGNESSFHVGYPNIGKNLFKIPSTESPGKLQLSSIITTEKPDQEITFRPPAKEDQEPIYSLKIINKQTRSFSSNIEPESVVLDPRTRINDKTKNGLEEKNSPLLQTIKKTTLKKVQSRRESSSYNQSPSHHGDHFLIKKMQNRHKKVIEENKGYSMYDFYGESSLSEVQKETTPFRRRPIKLKKLDDQMKGGSILNSLFVRG